MNNAKSMILAAGKGTRMGNLSNHTPKPLTVVGGMTMLDRALSAIKHANMGPTVINIHHLADIMEHHLQAKTLSGEVVISDERDELLETGGGIRHARPLLQDGPILVMNSDAVWTNGQNDTLKRLADHFDPDLMGALLLAVPLEKAMGYDGVGDLFIAPGHGPSTVMLRDEQPSAPYIFGGIMMVDARAYDGTPEGPWSNRLLFEKLQHEGRLYALAHDGDWMHVGTPDAIEMANKRLSDNKDFVCPV